MHAPRTSSTHSRPTHDTRSDAIRKAWLCSKKLRHAMSVRATIYEAYHIARALRSAALGATILAAIHAAAAIVRRAHARYRQRRQARSTYDALRQLDDRTLHDLGLHRSEITLLAAVNAQDIRHASIDDELDAWARHAHAANGFGDAAVSPTPTSRKT